MSGGRHGVRIPVTAEEAVVADWEPPAPGRPVAVFVPGFGSNRRGEKAAYFSQELTGRGWGFAAVDLRGHGDADGALGALTLTRCLEDLAALMDWLPAPEAPRLLIGSSMGAAVAGWHALGVLGAGHPPRAMAWIGPSWRFPRSALEPLPPAERAEWERTGVRRIRNEWLDVEIGYGLVTDAKRYDPERLARELACPTLILHGTEDEAVPWRQSLDFVERCRVQRAGLVLLKHGDHRLTARKRFLLAAILAWWEGLEEE